MRKSCVIRKVPCFGEGCNGPDTMYVVDMYENERKVGTNEFPGKSIYFVESFVENWEQGILDDKRTD